jgi:hypothetical protein
MMGFLAPLYLAGLLAIGLPILFHLIRRTPQGKQLFSSLMFLEVSPPSLTRRSRLSNILLLILRGLALVALALAFCRPFFNTGAQAEPGGKGKRVAILVDTSASMRRAGLWDEAVAQVHEVLKGTALGDQAALYVFDRQVRPVMTFDEWNQTEAGRRVETLKARLAGVKPSWEATRLGDALLAVADELSDKNGAGKEEGIAREIVLVSDLQQGGHPESLQGHQWPAGVTVQVHQVGRGAAKGSNAAVQWVTQLAEEGASGQKLRVRVVNDAGSTKEQFKLWWANEKGVLPEGAPVDVYVPAGKSQMVRVPWQTGDAKADRLLLTGDDEDFDNTLFVAPPRNDVLRVVYVGEDGAGDVNGLRYYLESALGSTPGRRVETVQRRGEVGEVIQEEDFQRVRLAVVGSAPTEEMAAKLKAYAEGGGTVVWALTSAKGAAGLEGLTGVAVEAKESGGGDYALLGKIDFTHTLFATFADARFSDFTKMRFWKHRQITWPTDGEVLARFENGDPFVVEHRLGKGRVVVMTSTWRPADSQLALSTKFVPLMENLVEQKETVAGQQVVGDIIEAQTSGGKAVITPEGKRVEGRVTAEEPGIYRIMAEGTSAEETPVAVNLTADESRTSPLAVEDLERWGVKLERTETAAAVAEEQESHERRLQSAELENRQKLWLWLIAGVLGLLIGETALAGRLARRPASGPVEEPST